MRGGATISARWPLPSGVSRSITRVVIGVWPVSSRSHSSGLIGVSSSNVLTFDVVVGNHAVDVENLLEPRALPRRCRWTMPLSSTPSRRPNFSIIVPGTNGSVRSRGEVRAPGCGGSRTRWGAFPARPSRPPAATVRRFRAARNPGDPGDRIAGRTNGDARRVRRRRHRVRRRHPRRRHRGCIRSGGYRGNVRRRRHHPRRPSLFLGHVTQNPYLNLAASRMQQRDAPLGSVKKNSECERSNTAMCRD